MPTALVLTSTCSGPGSGMSTSLIPKTKGFSKTPAFTFIVAVTSRQGLSLASPGNVYLLPCGLAKLLHGAHLNRSGLYAAKIVLGSQVRSLLGRVRPVVICHNN